MCFIKTVYKPVEYRHSLLPIDLDDSSSDQSSFKNETAHFSPQKSKNQIGKNKIESSLNSILLEMMAGGLKRNSISLNFIHERIQQCELKIDNLLRQYTHEENEAIQGEKILKDFSSEQYFTEEQTPIKEEYSQNLLTNKLFGEKKYKYRLVLEEEFTNVIYKQRNIRVKLALKNLNGKTVKNSNMVNLCLGLADDNGNWINMNRVGDPMLKGKTEVELYHGEAEFNKIYTKDISRTFPNGRVNIVVYAKPSMLIYDGLTSEYEQHVDEECVEPLVIEDVTIKAKKKY